MKIRSLLSAVICSLLLSATAAIAAQNLKVDPDGSITFQASTTSVTRISVIDDRIRRVVNDTTSFEMSNDADTGDVFLRFNGDKAMSETGFIVTEKGVTISYTLRPTKSSVQPVLIQVSGTEKTGFASSPSDFGSSGFSDDVASSLTSVVREIAQEFVLNRSVPGRSNGSTYKTIQKEDYTAIIKVASGGKSGRLVREQEFYSKGVLGVFVSRANLGPNERTFVIIVRGK